MQNVVMGEWFAGATTDTNAEQRFVNRLRELAPFWVAMGLTPEQSESVPVPKPWVGLELPHLSSPLRWLWILFVDSPDGDYIQCEWGDTTRFNDWGATNGNLYSPRKDRTATPEALAEISARWVLRQCARPVRRDDWGGRRARSRWSFADTGSVLFDSRPSLLSRNKQPDVSRIETSSS